MRKGNSFYILLAIVTALTLFGIVMVFSASQVIALREYGDSFYFLKKQFLAAAIGFTLLFLFSRFNYQHWRKGSKILLLVAIGLLIAVLIPGVGKTAGGSTRWVLGFQPSELAKLAMVLFAADVLSRRRQYLSNLYHLVVPVILVLGLIALLIVLEPNLGTTLIIVLSVFILLFVAGARLQHLFLIGTASLSVIILLILSADYRLQRLLAFLNPTEDPLGRGYHIIQSLIALGSGKIFGLGLGMSRQKFFYLPAAHTDFIFAIIGEELGLIGTLAVIVSFAILAYVGMRIAFRSRDHFGRLLAVGLTTTIVIQALINMGAVTGVLPVTGVPLPLISYGGSSLVFTLSAIGILLNIAAQEERSEKVIDARNYFRRGNRRTSLSRHRPRRRTKVS